MKELILGYCVDSLTLSECTTSVIASIASSGKCKWLACLNPHSYVVSLGDEVFSSALKDADWLIPDGIGIVFASRLLGGGIRQRVNGPAGSLLKNVLNFQFQSVFFHGVSNSNGR